MQHSQTRAVAYSTIAALGGLIFGLDAVLISGGVDEIRKEFGLTDLGLGFVVSSPGLGVLVALLVTGAVCDLIGRRKMLLAVAFLYVLSAVWSAFAPSWWQLWLARLLGGLAFTSLSLAPMYIGEIAPSRWRGKLVTISQINTVIGLSGAYFINYGILTASQSSAAWVEAIGLQPGNLWRFMLGSEILPAAIWFGLLFLIPESPRWLVFRGRDADANEALRQLVPADEVESQLQEIQQGLADEAKQAPLSAQLAELFGPALRIAVLVGVTIAIAQQATGINAIYFYAPTVFKQLGYNQNGAFVQSAVMGVVSLIFAVLALAVVDRVGRRPVAIFGFLWIIASLALCAYGFGQARYTLTAETLQELSTEFDATREEGQDEGLLLGLLEGLVGQTYNSDIAFKQAVATALGDYIGAAKVPPLESKLLEGSVSLPAILVVAGILSFIAAFQFSVGPVMWILLSEIFPTSVRGVAIPLFHFVTGVTSYAVQFLFPVALSTFGASAVFASFVAIPLVGLLVLSIWLPETKNLSLEEIQAAMSRRDRQAIAAPTEAVRSEAPVG